MSADGTHHVAGGNPAYALRFLEVLDGTGAYHITPDGLPAYGERHQRAFGFYEGRSAVQSPEGWFHILARVLHDWPDPEAAMILERAREAMPDGGCLYLIEMIVDDSPSGGLLDLNMLVTTGGMERSADWYGKLLSDAGFRVLDVVETRAVSSVIRARAI